MFCYERDEGLDEMGNLKDDREKDKSLADRVRSTICVTTLKRSSFVHLVYSGQDILSKTMGIRSKSAADESRLDGSRSDFTIIDARRRSRNGLNLYSEAR